MSPQSLRDSSGAATARAARLDVVDLGRGAVMALMALDHTRTFLTNVTYAPTDLARTYPALFFTRWTSQSCTPMFLFLAGVGAALSARRRRPRDAAWQLLTRGLLMVVLEMTAVRWGWYFNVDYRHTSLQILWAIGVAMMLLAPLVWLPPRAVGAVGLVVIVLHNLVGPALTTAFDGHWLWAVLYERGRALTVAPDVVVALNFPPLPLFGVMAAGYGFSDVLAWEPRSRRRVCVTVGLVLTLAFVVLRTFNVYGDPVPWSAQGDLAHSVMSFFLLTKHPLSLLMILATMGPALVWLGVVRPERPWWRPLVTIGRVPMFFYLVHVPLIHAIALALSLAQFGSSAWLFTSPFDRTASTQPPADWGFGLPGVYAWTLAVLAVLYPACRWLADRKAQSRTGWLGYL